MVEYEYKLVELTDSNFVENESRLNLLGKDGWEMVAVIQSALSGVPIIAYLKRRKG